jgi:hypothetical protein
MLPPSAITKGGASLIHAGGGLGRCAVRAQGSKVRFADDSEVTLTRFLRTELHELQEAVCTSDTLSRPGLSILGGRRRHRRIDRLEDLSMLTSRRTLLLHSLLAVPVFSADLFGPLHATAEGSSSSEQWYWYPFHNLTMKATSADTGNTTAWMLIENSPGRVSPSSS